MSNKRNSSSNDTRKSKKRKVSHSYNLRSSKKDVEINDSFGSSDDSDYDTDSSYDDFIDNDIDDDAYEIGDNFLGGLLDKYYSNYDEENELRATITYSMTKEEKDLFSDDIELIISKMKEKTIKPLDIIKSKIPLKQKIRLFEMYQIYINSNPSTQEYFSIQQKLYNIVKDPENQYTDKELEELDVLMKGNKRQSVLKRILNEDIPLDRKKVIYQEYLTCENSYTEESEKTMRWVEKALELPTKSHILFGERSLLNDGEKIALVKNQLDKKFYGQRVAKERILEIVGSILSNPSSPKLIAFEGPPGVGKTKFAQLLADVLDIPFSQISFGGVHDASFIQGHGRTYLGSEPGIISKSLIKMKVNNGILFMDEIDKISNEKNNEASSALLHVLDFEQNNKFKDHYFSTIPFDLSKLFFVLSLNDRNMIDPILRNRLEFIKFKPYDMNDKIHIAKNHFIPEILNKLNIPKDKFIFSDDVITYLVRKPEVLEDGVRKLRSHVKIIIERLNILDKLNQTQSDIKLSYNIDNFSTPLQVSKTHIDRIIIKGKLDPMRYYKGRF